MPKFLILALVPGFFFFACEKPQVTEVVSDGPCLITYNIYQKDSFQNYPKRILKFWPPHTTTELDIRCVGDQGFHSKHAQKNHGTGPDQVVHGVQILQRLKTMELRSSEEAARALDQAYRACECGGPYFSMEELSSQSEEIFSNLATKTSERMNCVNKTKIVDSLKKGKVTLNDLIGCDIDQNYQWKDAFDEATRHLSFPLDSYHVCNNDARLQEQLVMEFSKNKTVSVCNGRDKICSGPLLFYTP